MNVNVKKSNGGSVSEIMGHIYIIHCKTVTDRGRLPPSQKKQHKCM
jgi:hypothetical protein